MVEKPAELKADIYSLGKVIADMAKATGDKNLQKMATICTIPDTHRRPDSIEKLRKQPFSHHRDIYIIAILSLLILGLSATISFGIINRPFYQVMLMPNAKLALELRGMNSLLVLPKMWSIPMKKL